MNPEHYYRSHVAPMGSTLHNALFFEDRTKTDALLAIYALEKELADVPLRCHETELALKTLDWWQTEIDAAFKGTATHPVTLALQEVLRDADLAREYFHELLDAQRQLTRERHITEPSGLSLYCHRSGGILWFMAAEICGYTQRESQRVVISLGTHIKRFHHLARLRRYIDQGYLLLPVAMMEQHGVSIQDLQQVQTSARVQSLLQAIGDELNAAIRADLDRIPTPDRWALRHLIIQAELYLTLLEMFAEDKHRLLDHGLQLTPLRKLWIAWRIHRREKKVMKQTGL